MGFEAGLGFLGFQADLKKRVDESPGWVKTVLGRFAAPAGSVIAQRFVLFALLGAWSIANPSEGGPAFQVWIIIIMEGSHVTCDI